VKFHFCKKCGKRFEEGETILKRNARYGNGRRHTVAYYCVKCADSFYVHIGARR